MEAVAYVDEGRWVAQCPRCGRSQHHGKDQHTGHVGGLTGAWFWCVPADAVGPNPNPMAVPVRGCGLRCAVQWPPNVDDIMRLLLLRPDPATRNWQPWQDIHDLLAENVANGVLPVPLDAPDGPLISITGDKLTAGFCLPSPDRLALPKGA